MGVYSARTARREFLIYFGAATLFIGTLLLGYQHVSVKLARDALASREASRLELVAKTAERSLELITTDILVLAKSDTLQRLLLKREPDMLDWTRLAREFVVLSRQKGIYDQIRFLNTSGREIVRVNYNSGDPAIIAPEHLQDKAHRYYFKETFRLGKEEVFVSPMDLNVERGAVERPFKPMIRLGTPVFDGRGRKRGILIINYSAGDLLRVFDEIFAQAGGDGMLLSDDGYWLLAPDPGQSWGFMLDSGFSFARSHPDAWRRIREQEIGRIDGPDGMFVFSTVRPLLGTVTSVERSRPEPLTASERARAESYRWKTVFHLTPVEHAAMQLENMPLMLSLFIVLAAACGVGSWVLAGAREQKRRHEAEVRTQRDWLETLINAMPDIVYLKDSSDRWLVANAFAQKLLDLGKARYQGKSDAELAGLIPHHAKGLATLAEGDRRAWQSGTLNRREEVIPQTDGADRIFDVIRVPLFGTGGPRRGLVVIGRDVTQRKRTEGQLHESEKRLRMIANGVPAWIAYIDRWLRYRFANTRYELLGYRPDEMVGRQVSEVVGEEAFGRAQPHFEQVLVGQTVQFDNVIETVDGSRITVAVTLTPDVDAQGQVKGIFLLGQDITERKRVEENTARNLAVNRAIGEILRSSLEDVSLEEILQEGLDQLVSLSWLRLENRGAIFLVEPEAKRLRLVAKRNLEPELEQLCANVPIGKCLCGQAAEQGRVVFRSHITSDHEITVPGMAPHGHYCVPIGALGNVLGVINAYVPADHQRDAEEERFLLLVADTLAGIIKRKRAEAELQSALDAAELSNSELEQFAYVASHDLREPLRMITSYLQLLTRKYRGKIDADADEFIGFAVDGAQRMDSLIRDLLDYSRIGRLDQPMTAVDMGEVLNEAQDNLEVLVTDAGATVTLAEDLPVIIGSQTELARLFQNLIGNGIKFCHAARPPHIRIGATRDAAHWRFFIRDNGIGIAAKDADRVFSIFQRLHSREEYEGTGIGLAVCKKIVERHGGRIWVESVPGDGSTFFFTLPAAS